MPLKLLTMLSAPGDIFVEAHRKGHVAPADRDDGGRQKARAETDTAVQLPRFLRVPVKHARQRVRILILGTSHVVDVLTVRRV